MPLRPLTAIERQRIKRLTSESVDVTLIQPTRTGLEKGILGATAPVRNYLRDRGIHDYSMQGQGAAQHGVRLRAVLLSPSRAIPFRASLYRPKTKTGDPRIWFSGLPVYAKPDDMLAITTHDDWLCVINVTRIDIDHVLEVQQDGPLWEMIRAIGNSATLVSRELLAELRAIAASGPVPSVMQIRADTAVGRTLESLLGIEINSSREPNYKGIELKSFRRSRGNRKTLFAQIPNWSISKFKSSREILNTFGYDRNGTFRLYCTVSTQSWNSQGLAFNLDADSDTLNEVSDQPQFGAFASWYLQDLRNTLAKKHNETFWVSADVHRLGGHDHFQFNEVLHTKKPITAQFDILLEQGEITMDHLIKRTASGKVTEKGPLFKINSDSLGLLFPPS